jgi:Domain of unknown function (DUF4129)
MTPTLLPLEVPIRIGRDEAQRRAAEELAKAKYGGTPQWLSDLAERADAVVSRVVEFFLRIFGDRLGTGAGVNWGFVVVVLLLLAAVVLVVWRVGLPRWRGRRRDAEVQLDPTRAAADYRTAAEQAAAAGDWVTAVRDRFRAVVRELEVQTILDVRPARTASEAAFRASRVLPDCTDALRAGAETFNAVVYGDRAATPATYRRLVDLHDQVIAAAGRADLAAEETAAG